MAPSDSIWLASELMFEDISYAGLENNYLLFKEKGALRDPFLNGGMLRISFGGTHDVSGVNCFGFVLDR